LGSLSRSGNLGWMAEVAVFSSTLDVEAPAARVWDRMVDWPAHSRWVPLTRVRVVGGRADGVGARFVGRTGFGPLAFDDPMEVVQWVPPGEGTPGRCAVVKAGRLIRGTAEFTVVSRPGGCTVVWSEDVELAPVRLTRRLAPLIARVGRWGAQRALRAMAHEIGTEPVDGR
jgi:hypothetical protein